MHIVAAPQRQAGAMVDSLDVDDKIGTVEADMPGRARSAQRLRQRVVEEALFVGGRKGAAPNYSIKRSGSATAMTRTRK